MVAPEMAFGQQSGPPASSRQVQELLALIQGAGHRDFRDAARSDGVYPASSRGQVHPRGSQRIHRAASRWRVRSREAPRGPGTAPLRPSASPGPYAGRTAGPRASSSRLDGYRTPEVVDPGGAGAESPDRQGRGPRPVAVRPGHWRTTRSNETRLSPMNTKLTSRNERDSSRRGSRGAEEVIAVRRLFQRGYFERWPRRPEGDIDR